MTKWSVENMEHDTASGGVTAIHWRATETQEVGGEVYSASTYGVVSTTPEPSSEDFVPYEELTEVLVMEWIGAHVNAMEVADALNKEVQDQIEPVVGQGLPWS